MKRYYDDMEDWKEEEESSWLEGLEVVMEVKEATEESFGTGAGNAIELSLRRNPFIVRQDSSK